MEKLKLKAIIENGGKDKYGVWSCKLVFDESEAAKVSALLMQAQQVYEVTFKPEVE